MNRNKLKEMTKLKLYKVTIVSKINLIKGR